MPEDVPSPDSTRDEMDRIYTEMSPVEIPWNVESPPQELISLVEGRDERVKELQLALPNCRIMHGPGGPPIIDPQ